MTRRSLTPLTEIEWGKVFTARCRSKQGQRVSEEDQALCARALATDAKRYSEMNRDVFNATVPFGSNARWK